MSEQINQFPEGLFYIIHKTFSDNRLLSRLKNGVAELASATP